jgi:hypothetical protein
MARHIVRRFGRRVRVMRILGDDAETVTRAALMVEWIKQQKASFLVNKRCRPMKWSREIAPSKP